MGLDVYDLTARIGLDNSEYSRVLEESVEEGTTFGEKIGNILGKAAEIGKNALKMAASEAKQFISSSIQTGMQFDSSISQLAATMGLSMSELKEQTGTIDTAYGEFSGNLEEYAKFMGKNTAFSATQAAEALNYMALAGYDVDKSMNMLPNVLNLAAAGGIDLAYASDMVTDAQSALGLSMDDTTALINKMAMASSKSNTSVAQLGEAILTVGGTAKQMALGTTEVAQVLGLLADNGVKGSEGGTALRNILLRLTPKSKEAAEAMESLGFSAYDADGKLRPLGDIFTELNQKMSGMTDLERTNILSSIFNITDLKSVQALLGTSTDRWLELYSAIDASSGASQQMADTQLDNLAGSMKLFESAVEGAQLAISDRLSPALNELVKWGTKAVGELTDAFEEGGLLGALRKAWEITRETFANVASVVTNTFQNFATRLMQIDWVLVGQSMLEKITSAFSVVYDWFYTIFTTASSAIQAVEWGEVGQKIWGAIKSGISFVTTWFAERFRAAAEGIKAIDWKTVGETVWTTISNAVTGVKNFFVTIFTDAKDALLEPGIIDWSELGDSILEFITARINAAIDFFEAIFQKAHDAILDIKWADAGSAIWNGIKSGISFVVTWFGELFRKAAEGIRSIEWATVGDTIWSLISGALAAVGGFFVMQFTGAKDAILDAKNIDWAGLGASILELIESAFDGIGTIFTTIFTRAHDAITEIEWLEVGKTIWSKIKSGISFVVSWFGELFRSAASGIKDVNWKDVGETIWTVIKGAISGVTDFFVTVFENAKNILLSPTEGIDWAGLGESILDLIKSAFDAIKDVFGTIFGHAYDAILEIDWVEVGKKIWDRIKSGISFVVTWFAELFRSASDGIKSIEWDKVGDFIWGLIKGAITGVADFFKTVFQGAYDLLISPAEEGGIDWAGLGMAILGLIESAFDAIGTVFLTIFNHAYDAILEVDWADAGAKAWEKIKDAFKNIYSWFSNRFKGVKGAITSIDWKEAGSTALSKIKGGLDTIKETLGLVFESGFNYIKDTIVTPIATTIGGTFKSAWEGVKNYWDNTFKPAIDLLHSKLSLLVGAGQGKIEKITDAVGKGFYTAFENVESFWDEHFAPGIDWIVDKLSSLWQAIYYVYDLISGWLKPVFEDVGTTVNTLGTFLGNVGGYLQNGFVNAINTAIGWLRSLQSWISGMWKEVTDFVNNALTFITGGISDPAATMWDIPTPGKPSVPIIQGEWQGPMLPGRANGGTVRSGSVWVGEYEPEILTVKNGVATVTPINGHGRHTPVGGNQFTFNIYGNADPEETARQVQRVFIRWENERKAAGMS